MVRLLIPKDLPWLFPYRARWVVAAEVLFAVAWAAGLFESLSSPLEGLTISDRNVLHGLAFGLVPAAVVGLIPKLATRWTLGIMIASVLLWLLAARYSIGQAVFIDY